MATTEKKRRWLSLVVGIVLAMAGLYVYIEYPSFLRNDTEGGAARHSLGSTVRECMDAGGDWLDAYQECENTSASWCEERDGLYDACASACRHDRSMTGEALPCTTQCVQVCRLGSAAVLKPVKNPMDTTFVIDGSVVTLRNGRTGNELRIETRLWGQPVEVDVNGDGVIDQLMILVRDYAIEKDLKYYVTASLGVDGGYLGTNTVYIGDRIALEPAELVSGEVRVNYTERLPWEDMAARTSIGKTKRLVVQNGQLVDIDRPSLDEETARNLVVERWGECMEGACGELRTRVIDDGDGVWYVESVHDGLMDDSVRSVKRIDAVHNAEGAWVLGATLLEVRRCQEGRGQQGFLDAPCL